MTVVHKFGVKDGLPQLAFTKCNVVVVVVVFVKAWVGCQYIV